jgi:hypothetical protein
MIRHPRIVGNECRVNGKLVGHAWSAGKVWLWTAGSAELGIAESRKREARSRKAALQSLRQYVQNQLKRAAKQPHGIELGHQVAWAQPTRNGHNAYSGEVVKVDGDTLRVRVRRVNRDGQPLIDRFFNLGANKVARVA